MFSSLFGGKKSSDSTSTAKSLKEDKKAKLRKARDKNQATKPPIDNARSNAGQSNSEEDPMGPLKAGNNRSLNSYQPPATIINSTAKFIKESKSSHSTGHSHRKNEEDDDSESSEEEVSDRVREFYWDLEGVNLIAVLSAFYKKHSPDKVKSASTILESYAGAEVLMLQMMCDLYRLEEKVCSSLLVLSPCYPPPPPCALCLTRVMISLRTQPPLLPLSNHIPTSSTLSFLLSL